LECGVYITIKKILLIIHMQLHIKIEMLRTIKQLFFPFN